MSSEIANMMKIDLEGVDRISNLLKSMNRDSLKSINANLKRFYNLVEKNGVKQKQRRGIGYKIDVILNSNERLISCVEDPGFVPIEKQTFFSSNKFD
jgi:hypothetical protein